MPEDVGHRNDMLDVRLSCACVIPGLTSSSLMFGTHHKHPFD